MSDRFLIRLAMMLFIIIFPLLLVWLFNEGLTKAGIEKAIDKETKQDLGGSSED